MLAQARLLRTLTGHTVSVNSVSFSPDGQTLASGSGQGNPFVGCWHTGDHLRTLTGHIGEVLSVSFSPDGQTLASGSGRGYGSSDDNTVRLWDVDTGDHLRTLHRAYGLGSIACLLVPMVRRWQAGVGTRPSVYGMLAQVLLLRTLTGHTSWVRERVF